MPVSSSPGRSSSNQHPDADRGHDDVDHEQTDEGVDDGFVDGRADTLGPALHGQAAVAADQPGDDTEQQSLHPREPQLAEPGENGQAVDEGTGIDALQEDGEDV